MGRPGRTLLVVTALALAGLIGALAPKLFPAADDVGGPTHTDPYGRLASWRDKTATPCPAPGPRVAVILAAGQSNIGNHAEQRVTTDFPGRVFGFYAGQCMAAASPLLGATATAGEWLTLLGDALVRSGQWDAVVIAPAAVGGQPIRRFADAADLGAMLGETVAAVQARWRITHVLWTQGENDFLDRVTTTDYAAALQGIVDRLRAQRVDAPVFVSVTTYCPPMRPDWTADNPIAQALRAAPDPERGIFPGADSDAFDHIADRYDDCHLSAKGQQDMAAATARAITARADAQRK